MTIETTATALAEELRDAARDVDAYVDGPDAFDASVVLIPQDEDRFAPIPDPWSIPQDSADVPF